MIAKRRSHPIQHKSLTLEARLFFARREGRKQTYSPNNRRLGERGLLPQTKNPRREERAVIRVHLLLHYFTPVVQASGKIEIHSDSLINATARAASWGEGSQ